MRHVLVQITARVIVGSPLCRNTDYIKNAHMFMVEMCPRAVCISFTPELLRPLAGWWFSRPLKQWNAVCAKYMDPLVKQEMAHRRPSDQKTMPAPKTLLEQMARIAVRSTDPRDTDPFSISSRLLGLNFTSCLHQLVSRSTTSCAPRRRRSTTLEKIDSALRESLRISTFKARGLERVVVAPKGVTLPDGTHLRKGTKIGIPRHKQETIRAPQPNTAMSSSSTPAKRSSHLDMGNMPGRFMAAYELKLIIAYISMHYDIQPFEQRPPNAHFSDFNVGTFHSVKVRHFTVLEELTDWSNGVIELKVNAQINKFLGPDSSSRQG
ncbi:hypothetical protein KC368_g45 [Hortaea werneckii]|nr:hypothetical protein KC368_g45 [Hortaea werneckii]